MIPIPSEIPIRFDTSFLPYIVAQWKKTEPLKPVWYYASNPDTARIYAWRMIKKTNPNAWLHLFRHSRAEKFRSRGMTDRKLMAWFGWNDPRTPSRYTHPNEKTLKKMSEEIE